MSENPITPSNSGEENPNSPEQISDENQAALEALAKSHDDLEQRLAAKEAQLSELQAQVASLQSQAGSGKPKTLAEKLRWTDEDHSTEIVSDQPTSASAEKETKEQKSDTQRDLERLSQATGRPVDDPELLKLNLRLKVEQFAKMTAAYEAQAGTVRQEGFMQDLATSKRELEEAMYLYDPKFAEMDAEEARTKALYERATDPDEKSRLRQELLRLRDGSVGAGNEERLGGTPRRDAADQLAVRLGDIARSLDGSEILATYELNKGQHPEDPISSRRRTDTKDWKGKPEYEPIYDLPEGNKDRKIIGYSNRYIGSSPERTGDWVLEPKAPIGPAGEKIGESSGIKAGEVAGASSESGVGEIPTEGPEKQGESPEARTSVEVPKVDPGMYPDLYARMKNLAGGDAEKLKEEADRVAAEITANVQARVNNFLVENPDASPEQVKQFAMACYVDAQNNLQEDIISAIDGKGYENAAGEVIGRSALRRFGAWMDRNGGKLKKGMMIAGGIGLVAIGAGWAVGAIAPVIAIGAGTAIGAAKGAAVGLGMSRQGSKESYSKTVDASSEDFEKMFRDMDPADSASFARMSDYLMQNFNEAADKDHTQNVRKSRRAAVIGAVLGGIFGSISFQSTHEVTSSHTVQVHDKVELPKDAAPIQKGELSGQVIDRVLNQMGVEHKPFTMPDGSTNSSLIRDTLGSSYKDIWHKGTHSFAGAAALSDAGIRAVVTAIAKGAAGMHTETITQAVSNTFTNIPATIGGWITGGLLTGAATRQASDSVKNNELNR